MIGYEQDRRLYGPCSSVWIWEQMTQGIVEQAKSVVKTLMEAKIFAESNDLAALAASIPPTTLVPNSQLGMTPERMSATLAMVEWFLAQMQTPLAEGQLAPQQILFRVWPRPTEPPAAP